jgi:hypothetical protein
MPSTGGKRCLQCANRKHCISKKCYFRYSCFKVYITVSELSDSTLEPSEAKWIKERDI